MDCMVALQSLYGRLRASTGTHAAFSLLVRIILAQADKALRHYCAALIYNVLEPGYLSRSNDDCSSPTREVDISIKMLLEADDLTPDFYGTVFPYFQPLPWVVERLPVGIKTKAMRIYVSINGRVPEILTYVVIVIIGALTSSSVHTE